MIDTQLFAGARARGMKIAEVPVTHLPGWLGNLREGISKLASKALREFIFLVAAKARVAYREG